MNIPYAAIEPFEPLGIPKIYSKEKVENALSKIIRDVAERMDRENEARASEWLRDPKLRALLATLEKIKR
jgi:hypothetical protein